MNMIPIEKIAIGERVRKDYGEIDTLAESMRRVGQLQPVVLGEGMRLIAGARRIKAAKKLGWEKVSYVIVTKLTDAAGLLVAERDENTCRKPLNGREMVEVGRRLEELEGPMRGNPTGALCGPVECASMLREDMTGVRCEVRKAEYIEGSCLLTRTSLMKKHGLFAPWLRFAYGEDAELGLRIKSLGYSLHFAPVKIEHEGGATSSLVPGIREIEKRNHEEMRKRWGPYLRTRTHDFSFVVRRMAALGDALLASPIIDALAKRFPKSSIRVETGTPDLFINHPSVQAVSREPFPRTKEQVLINLDMAYENRPGMHIVDAYAQVAEGATQVELNVQRRTSLHFESDPYAGQLGAEWVAIHCEPTTWPGKNWPLDRWCEVIEWLRADGRKVVLVGDSRAAMLPHNRDLRMETSPLDLAAALSHCGLFIGHDSFPLHVAQSQGVPVVGLFGATRGRYILTDGSPSIAVEGESPCAGERHRVSGMTYVGCDSSCMKSISVEMVKEAVEKMTLTPA